MMNWKFWEKQAVPVVEIDKFAKAELNQLRQEVDKLQRELEFANQKVRTDLALKWPAMNSEKTRFVESEQRADALEKRCKFVEQQQESKISLAYSAGFQDAKENRLSKLDNGEPMDFSESRVLPREKLDHIRLAIKEGNPTMDDLVSEFVPVLIKEIDRRISEERGMAYFSTEMRRCEEKLRVAEDKIKEQNDELEAQKKQGMSRDQILEIRKENLITKERCERLNRLAEDYRIQVESLKGKGQQ